MSDPSEHGAPARPIRIVVGIDRLVLDAALAATDPAVVAAALRRELTGLLAQPDAVRALVQLGHVAHLDAGRVDAGRGAAPAQLGARVAQAIGRPLGARQDADRPGPLR